MENMVKVVMEDNDRFVLDLNDQEIYDIPEGCPEVWTDVVDTETGEFSYCRVFNYEGELYTEIFNF